MKENHVRFAQIQVLKGYFVGHKLICYDGWKSSSNFMIYLSEDLKKKLNDVDRLPL